MIEIIVIGIFLAALVKITLALKKQPESLPKVKASPPSSLIVIEGLTISYLTTAEARQRSKELRDSPDCIYSTVLLPEGAPERFRDPDVLWEELEALEKFEESLKPKFEESLKQVQEEIASSQLNSLGKGKMIPLCVSFGDRQKVKERVGLTLNDR